MKTLTLTDDQVNELSMLTKVGKPAYDFWYAILGEAPPGRVWDVNRHGRNTFTVNDTTNKLKRRAFIGEPPDV